MRTPCMLIAAMLAVPLDALLLAPLPTPRSAACARTRTPMLKDGDGLNNGLGGAMGGAVLGGLLAGPFGAIWGAQIGGSVGADRAAKRADEQRMERMGLTKEVRAAAAACAADLSEASESLKLTERAQRSAEVLVAQYDSTVNEAFAAAEAALRSGDEAAARQHLLRKREATVDLDRAKLAVAEAAERAESMRRSVTALEARAAEVEQYMGRAVTSAARSKDVELSADDLDDPLLARFRELEDR